MCVCWFIHIIQTLINDRIYNHITCNDVLKGHSDGFEIVCVCMLCIYIYITHTYEEKIYIVK